MMRSSTSPDESPVASPMHATERPSSAGAAASSSAAVPGLVGSATTLYTGPHSFNQAFEPGFVVSPFTADRRTVSTHRGPTVCLSCGGFLNMYCALNESTATWRCNLCGAENASLRTAGVVTSDQIRDEYVELQARHVDFEGLVASPDTITAKQLPEQVVIIALDTTICGDFEHVCQFLRACISPLSHSARVAIVSFSRSINLVRLFGGISQSVAVDVLPGDCDATPTIDHFISQGVYLTPSHVALSELESIAKTLMLMGTNPNPVDTPFASGSVAAMAKPIQAVAYANAILAVAKAIASAPGCCSTRLLLATGSGIPIDTSSAPWSPQRGDDDSTRIATDDVDAFKALAWHAMFSTADGCPFKSREDAYRSGCWIDCVRVGARAVNTDALDALCSVSGGSLFHAYTLGDPDLLESVSSCLGTGMDAFPCGGTMATLEVRTSPGMRVTHVIGPLHSAEQCAAASPPLRLDLATVDPRHIALHTAISEADKNVVKVSSNVTGESVFIDRAQYRDLYKYNKENTLICGLGRLDPLSTVSVQCKHIRSEIAPGNASARVAIQCVVRYIVHLHSSGVGSGSGPYKEVVRVMNASLPITEELDVYLQSLDAETWAVLMSRSIVSDFHAAEAQYMSARPERSGFGAAGSRDDDNKPLESVEEEAAKRVAPRLQALQQTEALLKDVLDYWTPIEAPPKPPRSWEGIDGAAISMDGSEVYILSRMDADDAVKPPLPPPPTSLQAEEGKSPSRTPFAPGGSGRGTSSSSSGWGSDGAGAGILEEEERRRRRDPAFQGMTVGASAASVVARMLYHLWSGPLLGGPSVDAQAAYLLQSSFLMVPIRHAERLLYPSVTYVCDNHVIREVIADQVQHSVISAAAVASPSSASVSYVSTGGAPTVQSLPAVSSASNLAHSAPLAATAPLAPSQRLSHPITVNAGGSLISSVSGADLSALYPPPPTRPPAAPADAPSPSNSPSPPPPPPPSGSETLARLAIAAGRALSAHPEPDTLWLLPGAILIVDVGHAIYIWDGDAAVPRDDKASSNKLIEDIRRHVLRHAWTSAQRRAASRRPAPLISLVRAGSSQERSVFAVLSPSHSDAPDVIATTQPHLKSARWADLRPALIQRAPITDELSFSKFLLKVSVSHGQEWGARCRLYNSDMANKMLHSAVESMDMDRGSKSLLQQPTIDILDAL